MKKILGIYSGTRQHCIGDGLLARTLFSQRTLGRHVSPFLSLDHVEPALVPSLVSSLMPSMVAAAVHPGAGMTSVKPTPYSNCKLLTMVYQGQLEYIDSAGKKKIIGAGDVQWTTLSDANAPGKFQRPGTRRSDAIEMLQLWIDLPSAADACTRQAPAEKLIVAGDIPSIHLPEGGGHIRVIAGNCEDHRGAMPTSSSFDIWELQLKSRCMSELKTVEGRSSLLAVLTGAVTINGDQAARSGEVVMLDKPGQGIFLEAHANTTALLLSGEAINVINAINLPLSLPAVGIMPS